jgi:hypothetical protein
MATVSELPSGRFRAQIRRKNLAAIGKMFDSRAEALAWGISREAELVTAKSSDVAGPNAGTTFAAAVQRYFDGPKFGDKAVGTHARERTSSSRPLEYFGDYAMSVIDGAMVQDYIDRRCNEKVRHKNGKTLDKKCRPTPSAWRKHFCQRCSNFRKGATWSPRISCAIPLSCRPVCRRKAALSLSRRWTCITPPGTWLPLRMRTLASSPGRTLY